LADFHRHHSFSKLLISFFLFFLKLKKEKKAQSFEKDGTSLNKEEKNCEGKGLEKSAVRIN